MINLRTHPEVQWNDTPNKIKFRCSEDAKTFNTEFLKHIITPSEVEYVSKKFLELVVLTEDKFNFSVDLSDCKGRMIVDYYTVFYRCKNNVLQTLVTCKGAPMYASIGTSVWCSKVFIVPEFYALVRQILIFKEFGEVEYKIAKPGKKAQTSFGKYELPMPIKILDSSWYTTLIINGTLVAGFFRMQVCGKNRSERKLIFVKPFERSTHVRKAKKLR